MTSLVLLDVNETLSDLSPLRRRLVEVGAPEHLLDTWFAATLRDGFALAAAGTSARFRDVGAGVLGPLLGGRSDAVDHVLGGFGELAVHPDVGPGLRRLREGGVRLVPFTNGDADLARGLLDRAGLAGVVERVLSVDGAGRWKPHPDAYAWALRTCGADAGDATLVAVHPWDVHGAQRAGLRGAWVDRAGAAYPPVFGVPDVTGGDLEEVAARLLG